MAPNNPVDLYDKTKYGDESYYNQWHHNNIEWINENRYDEKYMELLHLIEEATLSS